MKTIRKKREFSVVIERDAEGYYVASVPALPGCHTQAKSLDLLMPIPAPRKANSSASSGSPSADGPSPQTAWP